MTTHDAIPARQAALKTTTTPELKKQWRELFDSEPLPFKRRHLESRLAYRIQELAYGGLKPETVKRLEALGEQLDAGNITLRRIRADRDRPIAGTRLILEWQGVEHVVTVTADGFEWAGAPLQVALRHRPGHHRHALERLDLLRPQEPPESERRWPQASGRSGGSFAAANARSASGGPDNMTKPVVRKLRCAVYTPKSSEEGLEQEFNSLHAQREACASYIASQRSEGWVLVRDQYDDGGISGGTLDRPSLKRLLADVEDGLVDVVVVYKIDRQSRSLMDFAKLVDVFDRNGVTFMSVMQSFNTTTSMGRLTLNILLSFAQFEREVTAERIRDKVRASRMKGMWMGGVPPYGYRVEDRKLVVDEECAGHVRWIFAPFLETGSGTELAREVGKRGIRTPRGTRIDKKYLYRMLNNRAYIGEAVHKGESYPGEHDAIVDRETWDKVHAILQESPRKRAARTRAEMPALLKGLLFGPDGAAFSPSHTRKGGRLYRYYISQTVLKHGTGSCPVGRVSAGEIEAAVIDQLRAVFRQPEIVAGTWKAALTYDGDIAEADARAALQQLDPLWDGLFPAEQASIVALLVERIEIGSDG